MRGEGSVVGAVVERSRVGREPYRREVIDVELLDLVRPGRAARGAVADEADEVRRAVHVVVQVEVDLLPLGRRELARVVARADQTLFLRAPPREARAVLDHVVLVAIRIVDVELSRELDRDLEERRRAGAVVVDARPGKHRVEVSARHRDVVRVTDLCLGEDVRGLAILSDGLGEDVDGHVRIVAPELDQLGPDRVARPDHGPSKRGGPKRPAKDCRPAGLALVHDHDRARPGRLRVLGLLAERAGAALEQGDLPGLEAGGGEVGRLAAARRGVVRVRADRDDHVDRPQVRRDVTAARVGHGDEVLVLLVGLGIRRHALELGRRRLADELERELLDRHVVARLAKHGRDVVHGRLVAGCDGAAVAAVLVGDLLELLQMLPDIAVVHLVGEHLGGRSCERRGSGDCERTEHQRRQDE